MRKMILALLLTGSAMLVPGLSSPAEARVAFQVGAGFAVGPLQLSLVFGQPLYAPGPGYFYRSYQPIFFPGYEDTRYYVEDGAYYYDRDCPLVRAYFGRYRLSPDLVFARFAPRFGGGFGSRFDVGRRFDGRFDGRFDRDDRRFDRDGGRFDSRFDGRFDSRFDGRFDARRFDRRDDGRFETRRFDGRFDRNDHRSDGRIDGRSDRRFDQNTRRGHDQGGRPQDHRPRGGDGHRDDGHRH